MEVTTNNITDMLKNVVELLKINDDEKIELAIDILTLIIDFIGAENVMDALESGLENVMNYVSELVTGESPDLTAEQRAQHLELTRRKLDEIFEKMASA